MAPPPSDDPSSALSARGVSFAVGAYTLWGVTPIYWKWISEIPPDEVLIPRIIWTLLLLLAAARITGRQAQTWEASGTRWLWTLAAALLLATNWGIFIYAVQSNQMLATSLGYYINPLASIALGLLVLGERLNRIQTIAVAIAALGVASMTIQAGTLPWISLFLAGSFACYGLIHKLSPQPPIAGLTREMLVLSPLAMMGVAWLVSRSAPTSSASVLHLVDAPLKTHALLILAGVVTASPLLLFHASTRHLPLIAIGMLQYIAPTLTLILAVVVYDEPFTMPHAVGFGFVWAGLAVFTLDSIQRARRQAQLQ